MAGDPRTLWVSADGTVAVVRERDVPIGVWHGPRKDAAARGLAPAVLLAGTFLPKYMCRSVVSSSSPGTDNVCSVLRSDLPWEKGLWNTPCGLSSWTLEDTPKPVKTLSHYPHKCPRCGGESYNGGGPSDVDCKASCSPITTKR